MDGDSEWQIEMEKVFGGEGRAKKWDVVVRRTAVSLRRHLLLLYRRGNFGSIRVIKQANFDTKIQFSRKVSMQKGEIDRVSLLT